MDIPLKVLDHATGKMLQSCLASAIPRQGDYYDTSAGMQKVVFVVWRNFGAEVYCRPEELPIP